MSRQVVVVGGGITGLVAALELAERDDAPAVTLVEADDRLGGKILTEPFGGTDFDLGPDAFLARVPHGADLATRLGLGDELVSPAATSARLWSRGELRRIPEGTVMGVPAALVPLARSGVLSLPGVLRVALDPLVPGRPHAGDVGVGEVVRSRMGDEVLERLVDPLVGGINASHADRLSVDAAVAQLAPVVHESRSLLLGLRARRRAAPTPAREGPPAPVFWSLPGGLGRLVQRLTARLDDLGVTVRTGEAVTRVARAGSGVRVELGRGDSVEADGVVVTTPAWSAARLVRPASARAAELLEGIEHASVRLVAMAWPLEDVGVPLDASGFLVPRPEGTLMTACTWASSKWAHLQRPDVALLRVSAGRYGDDRALHLDDGALVERLVGELRPVMRLTGEPAAWRVARWDAAFPQYAPGHLDRVAAIDAALAEDVPAAVVAGAAYRGVGIPACIDQGRRAAGRMLEQLAGSSGG